MGGCQSAKPKHLKGKKNKRFPWVWGRRPQTQGNLLFFLPFRCLGLADLKPKSCSWPTGLGATIEEEKTSGEIFHFCCIKFVNLVCQLSCSSTLGMVPVLEITLTGRFSVTFEARNKNPGV